MKISAIVQARTSSTRLPEKVLKELPKGSGVTCLEQVIRRLKQSKILDEIIIATTTKKVDDRIIDIAKKEKVKRYQGSEEEENVLLRYYYSALANGVDVIVRITSDCPCVDSKIVDCAIRSHLKTKADYTSNTVMRTYPRGLDVEVFNFNVLEEAYISAREDYDLEHVTPYILKHTEKFTIYTIEAPLSLFYPDIRITLDTKEDYEFLCMIFEKLYPENEYFDAYDIVELLKGVK